MDLALNISQDNFLIIVNNWVKWLKNHYCVKFRESKINGHFEKEEFKSQYVKNLYCNKKENE